MPMPAFHTPDPFPELSYANAAQSPARRWLIRRIEGLSGRHRYAPLYETWKREIAPTGDRVFGRMLDLIGVRLDGAEAWPPAMPPEAPLVILANHPFGIGDGIAVLSLAERLGRPFRVMIHADLLKVPEIRPYALPVDFSETREATSANIAVRHEAVRLLKAGTTIVIFPAGGVATAPKGLGRAEDLPWKMFPARLIQEARATVLPVYFAGQNGPLFHLASRVSLTLRLSLIVREFIRLGGGTISCRIGAPIEWETLRRLSDRKDMLAHLRSVVMGLAPSRPRAGEAMRRLLPARTA